MLSLFTFILVLGIVVDDAIIVGENIALFKERGMDAADAAVKGATQVAKPVFFAVLTTMVTFSPMLAVEGGNRFDLENISVSSNVGFGLVFD